MKKHREAKRSLTLEELSGFCGQVAMMMNSGMALYEGMEALAQTHRGGATAESYARVSRSVTETGSLYTALKEDGSWPEYLVQMTGIGEQTGHLEEVMNDLAAYYERENRIRRAVVSAITYPLVLGVMMLLIILVMLFKVLPVFRQVLNNIGIELADSGSALMSVGSGICWAVMAVAGVVMLAVLLCCLLMQTGARAGLTRFLKKLFPPFRSINRRMTSARAAAVLSMMISSGFPLDGALEMVCSVIDDAEARAKLERAREKVGEGGSFGDAIMETGLFDELSGCMIRMGCTAGCVDSVMKKIAGIYEEQAEESIAALVSTIEPTLVAILSVVVGAVLMSVMLPMAGIISSIL